ncbi:oligosaccharide flippase family protein [Nubsella zeaxanthinifaciens]|uniref:oligosaccharide flippase family protein n=1 Tax=Nubsella zeaxanthinifaciens TaxID=392412 RepID=UPI000DE30455|nr:oligosaccharide flippase family protein [Nubsella zeaxanthinifaciens]
MKGYLVFVEKIVKILLSFYIGLLIANSLGVEEYGQYMLILSSLNVLQVFSGFGFDQYFPKYLLEKKRPDFINLLVVKISISIVALLITYILVVAFHIAVPYIIFFVFGIFSIFEIFETSFYKLNELKKLTYFKYSQQIITIAFKVYGIWQHKGAYFFISIYILEYAILSIYYAFYLYFNREKLSISFALNVKLEYLRAIFRDILHLGFNAVVIILFMKVDHYVTALFFNKRDLGEYSLMLSLFSAPLFISQLLNYLIFNWIGEKLKFGLTKNIRGFYKLFFISGFSCYIGVVSLAFCLRYFSILNGDYDKFIYYLLIYGMSLPFIFMGVVDNAINIITNRSRVILRKSFLSFAIGLSCYYPLIKIFGIYGICFASVITQLLNTFLLNALYNKFCFREQFKAIINIWDRKFYLEAYHKLK